MPTSPFKSPSKNVLPLASPDISTTPRTGGLSLGDNDDEQPKDERKESSEASNGPLGPL